MLSVFKVSVQLHSWQFYFWILKTGSNVKYISKALISYVLEHPKCQRCVLGLKRMRYSAGKESACNAGDPNSIPGLGRFSGEGIGYPFQHSWASLVAQLVKNLPTMWETSVRSLCWEKPLKTEQLSASVFWAENSMACKVDGVTKSQTWLSKFHTYFR